MPYSATEIRDKHAELKTRRAKEEPQWREIAEMMRPDAADIGTQGKRTRTGDDVYDSTPQDAVEQFVGGLFTQSTNPADRWFELGLADEDLAQWGPVRDYLWNYGALIYKSCGPEVSAFYATIPAMFADLGPFGLGNFYSDLRQGAERFTDVAVPLDESFVETDPMGYLIRFHRAFRWTGAMLKREFGDAAKGLDEKREYEIVHAVCENPDYREGAAGPRGMRLSSIYTCVDSSAPDFRVEGGYFEMPYFSIPWNMRPGRYPHGPGHKARADCNMLNEMERSHIVAAQFASEGLYLGWSESDITAADIQPGRVLHGAVSEAGKQLLQRVEMGGDIRLSLAQSEQRRNAIRQAFFFDIMQVLNRPQMTATEFLGLQEERLRLIGPYLGRIHTYGLSPFIARRARMLARAGMVPPPPRELAGQAIQVSFTSPLAKAQKVGQSRAILQYVQAVGGFATLDPSAIDNVDFDKASMALADGYGVGPGVQRSPDDIQARREARAQQMAQQQAVEQGAQLSKIYAEVAHADQAQTRAAQRTGGQA